MQGEDALKTVEECLRGRLLAERAATKTATTTADLFTVKVAELEEKLKIEEKCRRKAETKLKILIKKLESLKIGFNYNENIKLESEDEFSIISFSTDHEFSEKSTENSISRSSSNGDEEARNVSCLKASRFEEAKEKDEDNVEQEYKTMAIVPLNMLIESRDPSNMEVLKVNNERVREVLANLRQIRLSIQSTMDERRNPFQVGAGMY